jgi:hypothetical protein
VTNNTSNLTVHDTNRTNVSTVQLDVIAPTQGAGGATRIFEVEVWGSQSTSPPAPCYF